MAMMLQKAVMIFASTPAIGESPIEHIKTGVSKLTGEPICEVVNFELTCPECKLIQESLTTHVCDHRAGWRPPMHDPEILAILEAAYGPDTDHFSREIYGTQVSLANRYIPKNYIENIERADWYDFKESPDYIYISIDPATNSLHLDGIRSFFAMVTACIVDAQAIVSLYIYIHIYIYIKECFLFEHVCGAGVVILQEVGLMRRVVVD
jgi:hypothetical protein